MLDRCLMQFAIFALAYSHVDSRRFGLDKIGDWPTDEYTSTYRTVPRK